MKVSIQDKKIDITPFSIQVELTGMCNLKCRHCRAAKLAKENVSIDLFKKLIEFADIKNKFNMILSGGEPLLNESLADILSFLETQPVNEVVLTTNGTLLTKKHISLFKKIENFKFTVQVSIDSFDETEHNAIRGTEFAFKDAIRGIKLLVENNIFTSIRSTITPKQFSCMEDIVVRAIDLGVNRIGLSTIVPVGKASLLDKDLFFSGNEKKLFIDEYFRLKEKYSKQIEVVTHEPQKNCYRKRPSEKNLTWHFGGCTAGIGQFNMESDGTITPCALLGIPITNLKEKSVSDAQNEYVSSEIITRLLLKDYEGKCSGCKHKDFCGGCRAFSFGLSGNPFGEDVSCFI